MQDLVEEDFKISNLPVEVDIHHLQENEHRKAFIKSFSNLLSANESLFSVAKEVNVFAKDKLNWRFDSTKSWEQSLKRLAELSYDSDNMEIKIEVDNSTKLIIAMDPVYYAEL